MAKLAVFPGSFDPFTAGHASVCRRAADLFGKVVVLVSKNSEKKNFFSAEERLSIARAAVADDPRICVELCEGLVSEKARALGAACIVKGLRDSSDYNYESRFAFAMRELGAPEVVFLDVESALSGVSSTFVRELLIHGCDWRPYLPQGAHGVLQSILKEKV